jgi:hypothetical protein
MYVVLADCTCLAKLRFFTTGSVQKRFIFIAPQSILKLPKSTKLKRLTESNHWLNDDFEENSVKLDKVISKKKKKQNPKQAKGKLWNLIF